MSHARAIAVDALAIMGEMLRRTEKNTGLLKVGPAVPGGNRGDVPTYAEQGIDKKQAMRAQSLAKLRDAKPEVFEKVRAGKVSVSKSHALRVGLSYTSNPIPSA